MEDILEIPNSDLVFMRIHKANLDFSIADPIRRIRPVAYDPRGGTGLSVDWSAHCQPQDTKNRASVPSDNGVISMSVNKIRIIPLNVFHRPDLERNNLAHAEILGIPPRKPSDMGIRVKLMDISKWEIPCES